MDNVMFYNNKYKILLNLKFLNLFFKKDKSKKREINKIKKCLKNFV